MIHGLEPWTLLVMPALLASVLALLWFRLYPGIRDPNRLFLASQRPARLRRALTAILWGGGAVYLTLLAVRVVLLRSLLDGVHLDAASWVVGWPAVALFAGTLLCELVVVSHLFFYLGLCRAGVEHYRVEPVPEPPREAPKVAVMIPCCDELPEMLERPLASLGELRHPNLRVLLVENSRDPLRKAEALALAERHGVAALDLENCGTKAGALNRARTHLDADTRYLAVIDADQQLRGDLVSDLVALMERSPRTGWIQTTQTYDVDGSSLLATAATQQLLVLYDSALQGKDVRRACPILGTNYLLRLEALDAVGGWETEFVNEDTPTSYRMQLLGWEGRYRERVYAAGVAPPSIDGLWAQQRRWASANSKTALEILAGFFRGPRRAPRVVAEYLALCSYELLTIFIALLAVVPTAALVAGWFLLSADSGYLAVADRWQWAFASLYPFHVLLLFFPHVNMGLRGYPLRNLVLLQALTACLGPVYLQGVRRTLTGAISIFESPIRRRAARTTRRSPWRKLLAPQATGFAVFCVLGSLSTAIGLASASPFPWIIAFWSTFHAISLGHYLLFVVEDTRAERRDDGELPAASPERLPST